MNQFCGDLLKIVSVCVGLAAFALAVNGLVDDDWLIKDEVRKSARVIATAVIICMVILIAGYTIVALVGIK